MEIEYIRTETMDTKKEILQCPICQTTYSRRERIICYNIQKSFTVKVLHRKYHQRKPKNQTLRIILDGFSHSFTMIIPGATISGKTECIKRWCHPYQRKPYIMLRVLATILRTEC